MFGPLSVTGSRDGRDARSGIGSAPSFAPEYGSRSQSTRSLLGYESTEETTESTGGSETGYALAGRYAASSTA